MRNFVQPGNVITVLAPTGGIASGNGLKVGPLFGVAATDAADGEEVELALTGVFDLPSDAALAAFIPAYWNATTKKVTATASGNTLIGATVAVVGTAITRVRLNGVGA